MAGWRSAAEAYLVSDQIAAAKVPLIVHPTMQHPESMETINSYLGNAAAISEANIPIAIGSGCEGYVPKTRVVRQEAAMAMVYGLGRDAALQSITLDAARILGIDAQYGSLEPGKVGDVVLYDGDPFEYATHVVAVLVDGQTGLRPLAAQADLDGRTHLHVQPRDSLLPGLDGLVSDDRVALAARPSVHFLHRANSTLADKPPVPPT